MMRKYCRNCEAIHEIKISEELREYQIKDTNVSGIITILTCSHCGEEVYDRTTEIKNDIILFDDYKKKHNLLTSKEIVSIRENYGLSQAVFSKILGFGLKTITRYENGSIQDRTHDNLLRLVSVDANLLTLLNINRSSLSNNESSKIFRKLNIIDVPTTSYEYNEPCYMPYMTIIDNGGITNDGCK